jgi:hypothetical protein
MPLYTAQLPTTPYESVNAGVIPVDVFGVAINYNINRTPLTARLPQAPVGSLSFKITNDAFRPRSVATFTTDLTNVATTMVVADTSVYDVGDILQIDTEFLQITAIASSVNLTVTRGVAGTTAAAHTAASAVTYLITNARTGAEIDISSLSRIPVTVEQYCQTVQHAYQVGGALASASNYVSGYGPAIQRDKYMTMQHCMDDFESACLYGKGVQLAGVTTRPAMKGLRSLIATNLVAAPTNASAYKPSDLIRDVIQPCYTAGGVPSLLVASPDILSGLSAWGQNAQRLEAGATAFGTPIELFTVSFIPGLPIIVDPMLRKGSIVGLAADEVRIRMKRNLYEKPRGSRGDAEEGDFIMEGAIELDNESHHAWVEGITAFSA